MINVIVENEVSPTNQAVFCIRHGIHHSTKYLNTLNKCVMLLMDQSQM